MTTNYRPIEVIVADDHPIFLESLVTIINNSHECKLVGQVNNGEQLIQLSKKVKPDIIITDILMPILDGIEATKVISKELPGIGIIGLSMAGEESCIIDMIKAGAKGYILKNAYPEEIILAVKTVYQNQSYFSKEIASEITHLIASDNFNKSSHSQLTDKEKTIIKLICNQYSTKQIANELHLSKRAVDGLRDNILKKLEVKNIAGIVMYAIKNRIWK